MILETSQIDYGTHVIEYRLERRERATLEIAVEPDGLVRVKAPINAAMEEIAARVRKRARWILAQQRTFAQFRPRTPARRYVPGETHLYLGRQYRIRVVPVENASVTPDFAQVKMVRGFLEVTGIAFDDTAAIEKYVTSWFRERARIQLPRRVELNRQRFQIPGAVEPAGLRLQRMPKRWGSMSPGGRLLLNPNLICAPMDSIDYVITHELCHLLIPNHSRDFYELQETVMPDWQRRKQRLERILA
ncbi:SprT family zinc-dependent metalloprotease [Paenarthrobacter sp. PH39-S1]|uniref:M48 family metallopeptidase n=1 Tax=Paenarthrobacter sp. PH39-S1 TaxID=3046204 RepID=UPI0024B94BB1|nr:SprT family zinc-dependent metalloprotease [Paenarthrobacter sp. PH39-S1]MDJ0357497.1 SprT family zinc-dependent metalloprotease [Paenarthrobacter sp. PH39-S1]